MSDLMLAWNDDEAEADLVIDANDLALTDDLETAVIISLFTDARLPSDQELPVGETERRGWWGDTFADTAGDSVGSLLWTLSREKQVPAVLQKAGTYARAALRWLVDDGVASAVDVATEYPGDGWLTIAVTVTRPRLKPIAFRYAYNWAAQAAKRS
jgi:phage gp46-like protein